MNECIDTTQSLEAAIALAAVVAKVKIARRRRSAKPPLRWELGRGPPVATQSETQEAEMVRAGVLWLLGIPIPILLLMWAIGWLH
jgi:hypothetical protein